MNKFWIVNKIDNSTAEILLYGYIDPYDVSASDFVKELRSLEKEYKNINVRINSGGGSVFEGFAIFNAMRQSPANINTYIDGLAASMGSIIALAGKRVYISKVGQIMTHQPSTGGYGTSEELRKNADLLDALEKTLNGIYASKTGLSADDSKNKFMNGKDNWFSAEQAIEAKLADEIYDADPISLPATATSEKDKWDAFHTLRFAAKFTTHQKDNSNTMKEIKLSAAAIAALNIGDATDIDNVINELVAKAGRVDAAEAARTKAENDLAEFKKAGNKEKVAAMLDAAVNEKKITVELKAKFEKQFDGKPDELKEILDAMKPYESITGALNEKQKADEAIAKMTWDELDKEGKLEALKASNFELFKQKYKDQFNKDYEKK